MLDFIKKLIADYKLTHPTDLPQLYVGTPRGYVVGKPVDVDTFQDVVVIATAAGNSVGVVVSNILFGTTAEPEMESAGV